MRCFIGLGANLGDRRFTLNAAAQALSKLSPRMRASRIYENPAMAPPDAPLEWRIPFYNAVVEIDWPSGNPTELLAALKQIEKNLGRVPAPRWSPRAIDLDLIMLGDKRVRSEALNVPHADAWDRSFVLDPLKDLDPQLILPDQTVSVLKRSRELLSHAPFWMAILNVTPDSFSDGGRIDDEHALAARIDALGASGAQAIDVGAESTRPGAQPVSVAEECRRLEPALALLHARAQRDAFAPVTSVDTRRASTAEWALDRGADWINDVSGLADPEMAALIAARKCEYVLMHSLSVPADPSTTLPGDIDPVAIIKDWAMTKFTELERAGVDLNRVIFDPGIGFGKTAEQSLALLRRASEFLHLPTRVLIGHSRKSFMRLWTQGSGQTHTASIATGFSHRLDIESVGASLQLAQRGVDILRVHEPAQHIRAHRAYQESAAWNR